MQTGYVVLGLEDVEREDDEETKDQSDDNAVITIEGYKTMDECDDRPTKILGGVIIRENGTILNLSGQLIGRLVAKVNFDSKKLSPLKDNSLDNRIGLTIKEL